MAKGADAAMKEWTDETGTSFSGEPVEVIGPLAVWRTGPNSSKFLPLRTLSPQDCVRFYHAIKGQPALAARWSETKAKGSLEFVGRLKQAGEVWPENATLAALPEPELFIIVSLADNEDETWELFRNLLPFTNRVRNVYPGRVALVSMGQYLRMSAGPNWLQVDQNKMAEMTLANRVLPKTGLAMMIMTRHGSPLFGGPVKNLGDAIHLIDGASEMLWQLNPANPRTVRERGYYLRNVRPVEFAGQDAPPLLVGDLFNPEGMRKNQISEIEAKLSVDATGKISAVELLPDCDLPEPLRPAVQAMLRQNPQFAPALAKGAPAASSYHYKFTAPPPDRRLAADAAWVNGEARIDVPLKNWLVLKPVRVDEKIMTSVDHVASDGTVMLRPVRAGNNDPSSTGMQKNAFNSNWFDAAGADSLRPKAGDVQEVYGTKLTWTRVEAKDGYVDLLAPSYFGSADYCVGYAWTEIESPDDRDAWLGLGGDDGVKAWVNGVLVKNEWGQHRSYLDDDVVPLQLRKGKNRILLKIQNVRGYWSFIARLRSAAK